VLVVAENWEFSKLENMTVHATQDRKNRQADLSFADLQRRLTPVLQRHRIRKAILFGSRARAEASRHSDVDLILVQETERRFLDRYDPLLYELNMALPEVVVEALIYTPEELAQMQERRFIAQALREGQVIYESE
jgi:predicted nucleotidyltransferase